MTKQEFYKEFQRLHQKFPHDFPADPPKMRHLFESMESLSHGWWKALVNRIILTNNPKLSIFQALEGEIKARRRIEETKKLLQDEPRSCDGLSHFLHEVGCESLLDAVLKYKTI